jgi:2-amino-4-hydroxy-6-hydroxymethyldihydropteridine diphosphokinase
LSPEASDERGPTRGCWISVGSNVERERSICGAIADLRAVFGPLVISPVYETAAVGFQGEPFLNLVVGINTDWPVRRINQTLRSIEDAHGRERGPDKFAPRTLDLDLLTWGDGVGLIDDYELPRDEILKYAFVLAPLADVASAEHHPTVGRSYGELWQEMARSKAPLSRAALVIEGQPSD